MKHSVDGSPATRRFHGRGAWVLGGALMVCAPASHIESVAATRAVAAQVSIMTYPVTDGGVNLPYFDAGNRLQWNGDALSTPDADCGAPALALSVWASPRVDEWRCGNGRRYLVAPTEDGVRWRRLLAHRSGPHEIALAPIGANDRGIVLNSLEVVALTDGASLRGPPVKEFINEKRSVPLYNVADAGAAGTKAGEYFITAHTGAFAGAVDGCYRIDTVAGMRELLLPAERARGAPVRMEDMQLDPSGRYLLLAANWSYRGPNWVRLSIYDIAARKVVYEERHGKGGTVRDPRLFIGRDGHFAFSYRNDSRREYTVVRYRLIAPR